MNDVQGHPEYSTPPGRDAVECTDAVVAVRLLKELYTEATDFISERLKLVSRERLSDTRYRAFYPEVRTRITSHAFPDTRLSFGQVVGPGNYSTTVTRPDLFEAYLTQQIGLLIKNHAMPVHVGPSSCPMPLHFAVSQSTEMQLQPDAFNFPLRDVFDTPDISDLHDDIVNSLEYTNPDGSRPLAPFSALRIDYSLARLSHYTATDPQHFQNFVLFTNYQYYVNKFQEYARSAIADPTSGYESLVAPGNFVLDKPDGRIPQSEKIPQMPAYHLKRGDNNGITLVNIGIGPSNAKTATDHIAVLRPRAWLMLGHCAGLRAAQKLGDYVLAHAYLRDDRVLDDDLPVWVPVPALAEIQIALQEAVAEVTSYEGYELKRIMRTGTVATVDNRNWELRTNSGPVRRLSQSRAIALDMESATIAANGFRFRVPYGTLLCVSDKPLQGELKLPGMATRFYKSQVDRHLRIGIKALESLRMMPLEFLHSRKLISFDETAFL